MILYDYREEGADNMEFGFAIKYLRKGKIKYTQADLAEAIGVDRSYIGSLETNKRTPSLSTLIKIANSLGVTLRTLINLSVLNELLDKYTLPTGNNSQEIISNEQIEAIGTPEAYAFRDVYITFDKTNFHNHLGEFLDAIELRTKQYQDNKTPSNTKIEPVTSINNISLSKIINKGVKKENKVLFKNTLLTDGQLLGLNQYLEAITNQNNGGV
ncbi:helix-turn-helix transcriptional regulator [Enterococcus casseliflavus]|nr:helix-turn-helix transcriptional regulator [Enterococcus casseliflavus]MBO1143368.1 helix-turn-helix transcriptional regulator [Enterococcus casseliflavus]